MYAVFTDGSRQYRVSEGDVIEVDYDREADPGSSINFPQVLLYVNGDDVRIGQPEVEGIKVMTDVVDHTSEKLRIVHFRRRKNYRRVKGHRQWQTMVKVTSIG